MAASSRTSLQPRTCRHPVHRGTIALQRVAMSAFARAHQQPTNALPLGESLRCQDALSLAASLLGTWVRSTEVSDAHKADPGSATSARGVSPSAAQASILRRDPQILNVLGSLCFAHFRELPRRRSATLRRRPPCNAYRAPRHARGAAEVSCRAEAQRKPGCAQLRAGVEELTAGWTANATGSRNRDLPAFARPL